MITAGLRGREDLATTPARLTVPTTARTSRNWLPLAVVAAGFALLQLFTMGLGHVLGHDETVYLSQLNPAVPDFFWGAHRAWGVPVLTAPVAVVDAPMPVVRLYLIALSSLGLFVAYRPWLSVRDTLIVPVGAGLFASTYVVLYHGVMALPNYYTALGAVAAAGFFVNCCRETGSRVAPAGLAVAVAVTALVRPSDSLWLTVPLLLFWLAVPAWRRWVVGAAIVIGHVVGWAGWVVEAFVRFGGPWTRLAEARDAVGGELHVDLSMVELYVRMWSAAKLECYAGGPGPCSLSGPVGPVTVGWWVVAGALVLVGVVSAIHRRHAVEAVVPFAVGFSLAFSYLFMLHYGALRFLLPAGAVLALPAAGGVLALGRLGRPPVRTVGAAVAALLVLAHVGMHIDVARQLGEAPPRAGTHYLVLVQRLQELGVAPACLVLGDGAHSMAYQLGCESAGRPRDYPAEEPSWIQRARAEGKTVAAVFRSPPQSSYLDSWRKTEVDVAGGSWTTFVAAGREPPPGP